jgi:hypothetical protein
MPPNGENGRTPASKKQAQRRCARRFVPGAWRAGRPRRITVGGGSKAKAERSDGIAQGPCGFVG